MAVLRNCIGLFEDKLFATVFLGSGLLFVAMLFATVAVSHGRIATCSETTNDKRHGFELLGSLLFKQ
jgi:hypothetical protein